MLITVREDNKDVRIIMEEKIGLHEVTRFLKLLEGSIDFNITIDMRKVGPVDENMVELVVAAKKSLNWEKGKLCLISPPQTVVEMLNRSDFNGEINLF